MSMETYDGPDRRGIIPDRRGDGESSAYHGPERRSMDRQRGPGRRRSHARRAAEEGEMTQQQFEFLQAVEEYKKVNSRPFPSWTEVLDILRALGYRKVAEPQDIRSISQSQEETV